jgi:hypothetical protein
MRSHDVRATTAGLLFTAATATSLTAHKRASADLVRDLRDSGCVGVLAFYAGGTLYDLVF